MPATFRAQLRDAARESRLALEPRLPNSSAVVARRCEQQLDVGTSRAGRRTNEPERVCDRACQRAAPCEQIFQNFRAQSETMHTLVDRTDALRTGRDAHGIVIDEILADTGRCGYDRDPKPAQQLRI